jgi:hypothetical protein
VSRNFSLQPSSRLSQTYSVDLQKASIDFSPVEVMTHGTLSKIVVSFDMPRVLNLSEPDTNLGLRADLYEFEYQKDLSKPPLA